MSDSEKLDPAQTASQAAALAEHLRRAGVQFLPKPSDQSVALVDQFAVVAVDQSRDDAAAQVAESQTTNVPDPANVSDPANASSSNASEAHAPSRSEASPASRPPISATPARAPQRRVDTVAAFTAAEGDYPGQAKPLDQRVVQLQQLSDQVVACTACSVLANCRRQTVFGEGNPQARFVFFGEGPGADEDRSGRPFVGRAGQLLTKMISACTLNREDTYILNTVKCRPPGNRNPEPEEIANCRDYYEQQLQTIRPEYIVCLGAVAAQELLKTKLSVGRLRGKLHGYFASKVVVTYHPAYLLRTPPAKKAAWEDLQMMLADAGIDPNAK